ncbi:MAG TPA: VCBS repeat-containing protein [Solirubrobacter sp.]|nr:VCBS repeat-containing protein [Solirubrobacter sp.]
MRSLLLALALAAVPGAGDVNGDRVDDVVLEERVVFGQRGATRSLRRARGFRVHGGRSIAGDVNGDGRDDVITARGIVFGPRGRRGIALRGVRLDSVAGVGDVDGDGLDDVLAGAVDENAAYLVRGRRAPGTVELPRDAFLRIDGAPAGDQEMCDLENNVSEDPPAPCVDNAGWSVAGPGDVNGDGIPDLLIDASRPSIVFGRRTGGTVSLADLGAGGYRINGVSWTTHSVAAAGDVNGDGLGDFTIADTSSGWHDAIVVFGGGGGSGGFDYRRPGRRALRLMGDAIDPVSAAGDVNGDGRADLVTAGLNGNTGMVWVPFGGLRPGLTRLHAPGWRGLRIAVPDDEDGVVVPETRAVGDVNGDGRDDLLIEDGSGRVRIVRGGRRVRYLTFR